MLANLANCDDNKVTMLEHSGLLESILKIATLDLSEAAREYAAASLMDLASCQLNQIPMARTLVTKIKIPLLFKYLVMFCHQFGTCF